MGTWLNAGLNSLSHQDGRHWCDLFACVPRPQISFASDRAEALSKFCED